MINAREAAYLALLTSLREEDFIEDYLDSWKATSQPSPVDFNLAKEIAYGSCRMALALDWYAEQLTTNKELNLKRKEKALLRTAIYQKAFMDRIPLHAIVDETIKIAKNHCHHRFASFLNALLRKMERGLPQLPDDLSIKYSYPPYFIEELIKDYGKGTAEEILALQNKPGVTMARTRKSGEMILVRDNKELETIANSTDYYIQNSTPATLIQLLAKSIKKAPENILDLCASPGGKLIAAHDIFPKANLTANDISPAKLETLQSNLKKYDIHAQLTCNKGELFQTDKKFDLIILDVPCSNSGVLNKRPEARWRISKESMANLEHIQINLIKRATELLSQDGYIWYMTCSILKQENESLVEKMALQYNLNALFKKGCLPNKEGADGGFGCCLHKD